MVEIQIASGAIRHLLLTLEISLPDAYPGGSNGTDLIRFKGYLRRQARARGLTQGLYSRTGNAKMAENRLLRLCDEHGCAFNVQTRSRLQPVDGFVYVVF